MVHLSTIGPLAIHVGSTRLAAVSQRSCAALLYLVVERGKEIPRRTLLPLVFPDSSEAAGSHALRQLIYRLRKLGVRLEGDAANVTLPLDAATWDVEAIESRGRYSDAELESLGNGYLSDFAPGVSEAFDQWLDGHRSTVSTRLRRGVLAQLREDKAKHDVGGVDRAARACLALDPFNEEATLATAEVLVMSGSKTEALSVLDRYIDEVGQRSRELRLAPKLLRERISEYVADSGLLGEPPLVGRDTEMATLRALLSRAGHGGAEACVLWGSSGIGKSRLLNEACSIAALQGLAVVRCALQPHDQRRPLAILRDMAPRLLDLPGALGCSPESLALVRGLCGRGEMPARELPRTTQDSEVALASTIASATDLLDAVCSEGPVLLCVEDAHWLDPASIELIIEAVAGHRSLCILMASQRTLQLPQSLADAARLSSIEISRLSKESSTDLMHRLFERAGRTVDTEVVEWAVGLADGVPFYLQSLFVEHITTGDRAAIPSTLTASLASKLERLGEPTRSVFDAIVVLGKQCTLGRLEALVQLPRHALVTSLRELEERGLVRTGLSIVSSAHELFAVTARAKMPASVAKTFHRAAAEMLEAEAAGSPSAPWDIVEHWAASGDPARGLVVIRRCAQEALRVGRPQDAVDMLARTKDLAVSPEDQQGLLEDVFRAYMAAGQSLRAADAIVHLIRAEADRGRVPQIEWELALMESQYHGGLPVEPTARLAQLSLQRTLEPSLRLRAAKLQLYLAEDTVDANLARSSIESIADLESASPDFLLPHLVYHTVFGDVKVAVSIAEKMVDMGLQAKTERARHKLLYNAAYALWRGGHTANAIEAMSLSHAAAEAIGLWTGCADAASFLAEMYWQDDDLESARHWLDKAGAEMARTPFPDHGPQYYANRVMFALADGAPDEAERLLDLCSELYPYVLHHRRAVENLAYKTRIRLSRGNRLETADVDRLVAGHLATRASGVQDIVADTVVMALESIGRCNEAAELRKDYLTIWRRDRFPLAKALKSLRAFAAD